MKINQNQYSKICTLEYIYKKTPAELIGNTSIADLRIILGKHLYEQIPSQIINNIDAIVPCPQTGIYYALGVSLASNKPYIPAILNLSLNKRYLSISDADTRKKFIHSKLLPIKSLVENKKIIVIDEAIFTGMTLKILSEMLHNYNVASIHLCIPSPVCVRKCIYNKMPQKNILLESIREDMLCEYFNVESITFQNFTKFKAIMKGYCSNICLDCFTLT